MPITQTTLAADLAAVGNTVRVTSGTGFPTVGASPVTPQVVRIDNEFMLAIGQPVAGVIKVAQRGYGGTAVVAHDLLAKVSVAATPADFADPAASQVVPIPIDAPIQETLGESRTFTASEVASWGNRARNFALTKATALAIVLVAPSKGQDGLTLVFTNDTTAAHVLTATTLINDGVTGGAKTTATFAAFPGSALTLQAQNGLWNVISAVACPIT